MIVISTGFNTRDYGHCVDSVRKQKNACFEHVVIDAAKQVVPMAAMYNLHNVISALAKNSVVVCVDLDDWLPHDRVLERVQQMHDAGAWVTYGSYQFADGRPGHVKPYASTNYRGSSWLASHLKTFRAGLFHRITGDDLHYQGEWLHRCVDLATMFPVLEMAGDRVTCCGDVLYTYNFGESFEFAATPEQLREERRIERYVRTRKPYEVVTCL